MVDQVLSGITVRARERINTLRGLASESLSSPQVIPAVMCFEPELNPQLSKSEINIGFYVEADFEKIKDEIVTVADMEIVLFGMPDFLDRARGKTLDYLDGEFTLI